MPSIPSYCRCGSGKPSRWLTDSQNIPLRGVCDDCEEAAKAKYEPWVFSGYDQAFLDEYSGERIEPLD